MKQKSLKRSLFARFAQNAARITGKPASFFTALMIIVIWAVTGPIFDFNDTWQLVINTSTTIITFLMVFLIQNAQNRDSMAVQLKLDELLRAVKGAHNSLIDLEALEEFELEAIRCKFEEVAHKARTELRSKKDPFEFFAVSNTKTD